MLTRNQRIAAVLLILNITTSSCQHESMPDRAELTDLSQTKDLTAFPMPDLAVCHPSCEGKMCGSDGCSGLCGICKSDEECQVDQCIHSLCRMEAFLNGGFKARCGGGPANFTDCPNFFYEFTNCLCISSCMSHDQCENRLQGGFSMVECQGGAKTAKQLIDKMSNYLSADSNYCWKEFGGNMYGTLTLKPTGDCSAIPRPQIGTHKGRRS